MKYDLSYSPVLNHRAGREKDPPPTIIYGRLRFQISDVKETMSRKLFLFLCH